MKIKLLQAKKVVYKYESASGMYLLDVAYKLKTPSDITLTGSNYTSYFDPRLYYDKYDSKGKTLQIRTDADKIVYLWSYNYQYPIAKIENATYSVVAGILGQTLIDRVAAADPPASGDLTAINNLRSNANLQNDLITTYTYKPLYGMLTMTDPRGVVTEYTYDTFGRLQKVTKAGRVIETYTYNYKN